jgi:hypothetical protein
MANVISAAGNIFLSGRRADLTLAKTFYASHGRSGKGKRQRLAGGCQKEPGKICAEGRSSYTMGSRI